MKNMKNKDFYKKELAKFNTPSPVLVNGKLVECLGTDCITCDFYQGDNDCGDRYEEWLNAKVNVDENEEVENDDTENKRYVLTEGYIMQLSLKDFNIEVSLPMARAIKDRFLELMVQHGHMRKEEN